MFRSFLILLTILPLITGAILELPRDTAALLGSRDVRLNCTVTPGQGFKWETIVDWQLRQQVIFSSETGTPVIPVNSNFTVSPNGSSISINTLSSGLAAIYICAADNDYAVARVAAMKPLSCNPMGDISVKDGDQIPFNCSTFYENYVKSPTKPMKPTLALVKNDGTVLMKDKAAGPGLFFLSGNVTASRDMDSTRLTCKLYFEDDDLDNLQAMKVKPALYEDSCYYDVFVQHEVTWAKIDTQLNDTTSNVVYVGHTITCSADGSPKPTFEWFNYNNTQIGNGDSLTMTMSMVSPQPVTFKCVATNVLPGNALYKVPVSDSVELIVSTPASAESVQALPTWAIALIVVIPLVVILLVIILIVILCLRRRKQEKPYKAPPAKKNGKYDPSLKNLIYTPTVPNTGPGIPGYPAYPNTAPTKSPPTRTEYPTSPFGRPDHSVVDDFNSSRNMNASVGHGALGVSGLSGSRAADLNLGSRGNIQEAGRQQQDNSISPRAARPSYGGSSEGLNFPPLPPRQPDPSRYYDNHEAPGGSKRGRQQHESKTKSPPPPASYLDHGFGRQPSITSTSTNRSGSSEGSRMVGRIDNNPSGRPSKGGKRVSPKNQGQVHAEGARRHGKKTTKQSETGHPSDVHSLQGSEV